VQIFENRTQVESQLFLERRDGVDDDADLVLDGEDVKLLKVVLNGSELKEGGDYEVKGEKLKISGKALSSASGEGLRLETQVEIVPEKNTQLSGLYYSGTMYCTQMEAEGFRRFTYFLDRPDVMAKYTKVRIEADKEKCPVLLSNGNVMEKGDLDDGRHFAVFQDPFPKPSYLFALVAGDLGSITDSYTTLSGRKVHLEVFSAHRDVDQLWHAMESLKRAMKWDEDRYGLEYDLDNYYIVAVGDFNMGAMENKGLNVFNTSLTLAKPDTATDDDYERVEGVIGHEYFHNWTGNRVTCRDWFQLTLKEGLTVYRDQEFSSDVGSRAAQRIENVRILRAAQFPEDSSPMAHPIRPEKYAAIDNFYTATVYNKGAEVIRMYETLLGRDGFRKGMDLYFERHDGNAVSCDDFRLAMADSNNRDLTQFENWYLQAGTPVVTVEDKWDEASGTYTLEISQELPDTPGQTDKKPMLIPIRVGLLDRSSGEELVANTVLELVKEKQSFELKVPKGCSEKPVPSLLRDFSAPVRLQYPYTDKELALLAGNDTDSFNRWEAMQQLGTKAVLSAYESADGDAEPDEAFVEAVRLNLVDKETKDLSLIAFALILPTEGTLMEIIKPPIDPTKLHKARNSVRSVLATKLRSEFTARYEELTPKPDEPYKVDGESASRRRLRNICLAYLSTACDDAAAKLCGEHFTTAGGMTDKAAALAALCSMPDTEEAKGAVAKFYADANGDANVVDKWFAFQARADVDDLLPRVKKLMEHPDFTLKNPNRLRSVVGPYVTSAQFHDPDGSGYAFAADLLIEVDALNPQIAARMCGAAFRPVPKLEEGRKALATEQLQKLAAAPLSKDTLEIVTKMLG